MMKKAEREPAWIEDWRRAYKKASFTSEDLAGYERDNASFDFEDFKGLVESEAAKGNIRPGLAKQLLETGKKVPIYESPVTFPQLMEWSKQLETAIPQVIKLEDDKSQEDFRLEHSPYIITLRMGELNAATGPIPGSGDTDYYYIALDIFFVYFVQRIGNVSSRLFDVKNMEKIRDIKKIFEQNLERDSDIYKYFRDVFFFLMFSGNQNLKDKNLLKVLLVEIFENQLGSLPPPELDEDLFCKVGDVIEDSIGLFIMGHEYAHIILHLMAESDADYIKNVRSYQQEFQADYLGLRLACACIQHNYPNKAKMPLYFIGVEIALNCLYIIDRLRGLLDGSGGPTVYGTHPPTKTRMENIRKHIQNLCKEWGPGNAHFFDCLDDIFQKLGDRLVDEILNNDYVLNFLRTKRGKIEDLEKEAENLWKKKLAKEQAGGIECHEFDSEIISACKAVLKEEPNDILTLFILGSLYLENHQDDEAAEYFLKVIVIAESGAMENRSFDRMRHYISLYYIGYCYIQKAKSMMLNSEENPSPEQKKKIGKILDNAIFYLEAGIPYYNHRGEAFYYLGLALYSKNEHRKAVENFNKALEYQPGSPRILYARQLSLGELKEFNH
jgi:tetratricopeptide (TPR) repeat protein